MYWDESGSDNGTFKAVHFDLSGTTDTLKSPNNSAYPSKKLLQLVDPFGTTHSNI
jgi:hypothetical protein